jgi:hypothetical protein
VNVLLDKPSVLTRRHSSSCGSEFLWSKSGPIEAELAHAGAEGVRVDVEEAGGAICAFDAAASGNEGSFDMFFHGFVERS